jgi:hypothetical protein
MGRPVPIRASVVEDATRAAADLERRLRPLADRRLGPGDVASLLAGVLAEIGRPSSSGDLARAALERAGGDWDRAAQAYLALAALYYAQDDLASGSRDPALRAPIEAMARALEFPPGYDSPRVRRLAGSPR